MNSHDSLTPATRPRSRRWLAAAIAVLVVLIALAAFAARRNASSAAKPEDCETKPPPNTFAVAQCDEGGAAGAQKPGSASPANPSKP